MENEQLKSYVEGERARGVQDSDLKTELLAKGWKETDVDMALGINVSVSQVQEPAKAVEGATRKVRLRDTTNEPGSQSIAIIGGVRAPRKQE